MYILVPTVSPFTTSVLLRLALICWIIHYTKRLLETAFVHRFSHATMPIFNLFKVSCGAVCVCVCVCVCVHMCMCVCLYTSMYAQCHSTAVFTTHVRMCAGLPLLTCFHHLTHCKPFQYQVTFHISFILCYCYTVLFIIK